MKIGLIYAMTGEIESLLTKENVEPLQTVCIVTGNERDYGEYI